MGAISIATHRQRKLNPGAATAELTLCASPREETPGKAELYAQQSGEEGLGAVAGGMALVELQVLPSQ
jgi:hypothetical protein